METAKEAPKLEAQSPATLNLRKKKSQKVFNGRKTWKIEDPDMNDALDRIEKLETDMDYLEKERQLFEAESKKA